MPPVIIRIVCAPARYAQRRRLQERVASAADRQVARFNGARDQDEDDEDADKYQFGALSHDDLRAQRQTRTLCSWRSRFAPAETVGS